MIKNGAEPLYQEGNGIGILFLHGFTASPHELRDFAVKIHQNRGYTVSVPLLAGHGNSNELLNATTFQQFIDSAESAFTNLKNKCEFIFLVGMSMGGSLAIDIASKNKVNGLVLMGTPLFLPLKTIFLPFVLPVKTFLKKHDGPDIKDHDAALHVVGNDSIPLRALKEFKKMLHHIRKCVKNIICPTLIMHSVNDHTINYRNAKLIFKRISSDDKRLISYQNSYHILSLDFDRDSVFHEIDSFIVDKSSK